MVGKKIIASAIGAVLGICLFSAQAAITEIVPTIMDDLSVSVSLQIKPGNDVYDTDLLAYLDANPWTVRVTAVNPGLNPASMLVVVFGSHNVGPHTEELAPNPNTFNVPFSAMILGNPPYTSTSVALNTPHPEGNHQDSWVATLAGPGQGNAYTLDITGEHVIPEPHQYALMAGLGLLAFGFYRRVRG